MAPASASASAQLLGGEVRRRRVPVLRELDLTLGSGVTAILGANGVGKSTLLRTLATLHPLGAGELHIDGIRVRTERDAHRARRRLGYLEQEPGFPGRFTVVEALTYAAWLREIDDRARAVDGTIERFGLGRWASTPLRRLSGGTRRRALLAQAVIHEPAILLLDEPTVGMDVQHRLVLRDDLAALGSRCAVVVATHMVDDLAALDPHLVILAGDTVAFDGDLASMRALATPRRP